jgi:hypothetical protein
MSNKSITQISSRDEKHNSLCSYKEEFFRIFFELHKVGNIMTATYRPKGYGEQFQKIVMTPRHWIFGIKKVPVESFVGRQQVPVVRGKD